MHEDGNDDNGDGDDENCNNGDDDAFVSSFI